MDYLPIFLDTIDSTNNYAINLISKSNPIEGTVITTYNQADGKGQIGRKWFSDVNKNITTSFITYPNFLEISKQFYLSIVLSLALYDTINAIIDDSVFIKWPNDIYVRNKKIAGLLINIGLQGKEIKYCVMGIGLNVNQKSFPQDLPQAISLYSILHRECDKEELLEMLHSNLDKYYNKLKLENHEALLHLYNEKLFRKNQLTSFYTEQDLLIKAIPIEVISSGHLIILLDSEKKAFTLRQLRMKI